MNELTCNYHHVPSSSKLIDEQADSTQATSSDSDTEVTYLTQKPNHTHQKDLKFKRKPRTKSFNESENGKAAHTLRSSFKSILAGGTKSIKFDFKDEEEEEDEEDNDDLDDQVNFKDIFKKKTFLSQSYEEKPNHRTGLLHINTNNNNNNNNTETNKINQEVISSASASSSSSSTSSYNNSTRSESTLNDSNNNRRIDFDKEQIKKFINTTKSDKLDGKNISLEPINKFNGSIRMRHNSYQFNNNNNDTSLDLNATSTNNSSSCILNNENGLLTSINVHQIKEMSSSGDTVSSINTQDKSRVRFVKLCRRTSYREKRVNNTFIILLLFVVNLLNFIDRYTLAGVLKETQDYFKIDDSSSGLLQTVFICSYMLLAPLFGYLGDRYPRKWIIIFGVSFWSLMTFLGSFVPKDKFWIFLILRSLVGIGEASYSCIAPTIIGDLFTNQTRTKMLAIFYLAVPVGSGLGYIVGSNIAKAFDDWRWALRFTPPLGFICVLLLIFFVNEPKRGGAEGSVNYEENKASLLSDVIYLFKNRTFMWVTAGFTFSSFVLGGLSWWVPLYVQYAIFSKNQVPQQIPLLFGVVTCFSGLLGVSLSSLTAPKLRSIKPYSDALVCATGSLIAVPSLFILVLITRDSNPVLFWFISGVAISALCLSWTLVSDILLYVIHPNKRSTASAFNILICHLFGDAGSPYVIGAISDFLRSGKPDTYFNRFSSLQTALYAAPFFSALSFASYLFSAIYLESDKKKVDILIKKNQKLNDDTTIIINKEMNSSNNDEEEEEEEAAYTNPLIVSNGDLNEKIINDKVKNVNENLSKHIEKKLHKKSSIKILNSDLNKK